MNRKKFLRNSSAAAGALLLTPQSIFAQEHVLQKTNLNTTKLKDVNTTSIAAAITLGLNAINNGFDADDNDIPFNGAAVLPEPHFLFHRFFSEACTAGANLLGLLKSEEALKQPSDELAEKKLTNALFFSFSGPIALPLNRHKEKGKPVNFVPLTLSENLPGLAALVKFRKSEKAQQLMEKCIETIFEYWTPEKGWNANRMFEKHGINCFQVFQRYDAPSKIPFITSTGRALGGLSVYYEVTRSTNALKLIELLRDIATTEYFTPDGNYDREKMGAHSSGIIWILLSLARTAIVLKDTNLMNRVKNFYDNGLKSISNPLGWSPEPLKYFNPDTEGIMDPGRVLETALIIGQQDNTDYFQHCEQLLRARLLPSQLRDISWIPPINNTYGLDEYRDVAQRIQGSWQGATPYGFQPPKDDKLYNGNFTIGGDVHGDVMTSISEAYINATEYDNKQHKVNLHFDHKTNDIEVKSPYTNHGLRIIPKSPGNILVRLPIWTKQNEVKVSGGKILPTIKNGYLNIKPDAAEVVIDFPLTKRDLELPYRDKKIRIRMSGDQVLQMDNLGTELYFFDPYI